ncbi:MULTISPECIES: hypothetical protein [Levilactobacillus]|uniref:hypothetical protein n=1 Tax=Levilactobacillus TaxID=2767886 RepID=UPI00194E7E42|nr:hypothetical protein [Levilactobacillus sp. 244-2]
MKKPVVILTSIIATTALFLTVPTTAQASFHHTTTPKSLRGSWVQKKGRNKYNLKITKYTLHTSYYRGSKKISSETLSGKKKAPYANHSILDVSSNAVHSGYWVLGKYATDDTGEFKRVHRNGKTALRELIPSYSQGGYSSLYFYKKTAKKANSVKSSAKKTHNYTGQKSVKISGRYFPSKKYTSFNNVQTGAKLKIKNTSGKKYRINFKKFHVTYHGSTVKKNYTHKSIVIKPHSTKSVTNAFVVNGQAALDNNKVSLNSHHIFSLRYHNPDAN